VTNHKKGIEKLRRYKKVPRKRGGKEEDRRLWEGKKDLAEGCLR